MNRTAPLSKPLITLLSPSPEASRKAQSLLSSLCHLENVRFNVSADDELNEAFSSSIPGFSRKWDSVASKCPLSGCLLHFCTMESSEREEERNGSFSLLAITDAPSKKTNVESIQHFRDFFASQVKDKAPWIKIKGSFGGKLSSGELLSSITNGGLPLLSLPEQELERKQSIEEVPFDGLKEVVIPYFDYASYTDGSTLLSKLSYAQLKRPNVGLYQWTNSFTRIRPLPTAHEDRTLPPVSLIFHCETLDEIEVKEYNATTAKIGFGGRGSGQLMLRHPGLSGLDVRYCSLTKASSNFSEAQDSLLAGSLQELQSTNTLLAGSEEAKEDDRIGKSDCWVELRANLKQPSGFFQRSPRERRPAKAPDLPYE